MSTNIHSAKGQYLGYRFQPLYALLILLKESLDDSDRVSVEQDDDVTLNGTEVVILYQLKHTISKPSTLTVANEGLWKTIRIWSQYANSKKHKLVFVTQDNITSNNLLIKLVNGDKEREDVVDLMIKEANKVIEARKLAILNNKKSLPYEGKFLGCESFLSLNKDEKLSLINKIIIRSSSFDIFHVEKEVIEWLKDVVVKKMRQSIANRLLEWWDKRMIDCTNGVTKEELTTYIQNLIGQFQDDNLPDDFSKLLPSVLDIEIGGGMEQQIDLVDGGSSRKKRAAIARWRSRNQREKWIKDDILNAFELEEYDEILIESWKDRYEPMQDDTFGKTEEHCKQEGLKILDWTHFNAHQDINALRTKWIHYFLIQGSYQQLSNEFKVGWHPQFKTILGDDK
ncbi:ABC-three component system protein [Paenibacillus nicotianae]|uniref:ABC-three component system protein n=1 Tax=Paenibacillus nicotianae TaxID=1526551 RepID=A0ABW4UXA5_9BACL